MDNRPYIFLILPFWFFFWMPSQSTNSVPEFRISRGSVEFDHLYFEDHDDLYYVQDICN
jgi:hypothetical protein